MLVERGLLRKAALALGDLLPPGARLQIVTSKPVRKHWGKALEKGLRPLSGKASIFEMPDGERAKRLANLEELAEQLVASGADRQSVVVALGGG